MEKHQRGTNPAVSAKVRSLRLEIEREFGVGTRFAARTFGPAVLWALRREERRVAQGKTYEPRTIVERRNWPAAGSPIERLAPVLSPPMPAAE